ncbi:hypothetical protein Tco_0386850 [Tanacetum coccineum]|uniref:Uncharacterized protein n=1 Tax=Tanacetum coccineum TaxID=301880 RepID=A0ABQ5DUK7_9ASTR
MRISLGVVPSWAPPRSSSVPRLPVLVLSPRVCVALPAPSALWSARRAGTLPTGGSFSSAAAPTCPLLGLCCAASRSGSNRPARRFFALRRARGASAPPRWGGVLRFCLAVVSSPAGQGCDLADCSLPPSPRLRRAPFFLSSTGVGGCPTSASGFFPSLSRALSVLQYASLGGCFCCLEIIFSPRLAFRLAPASAGPHARRARSSLTSGLTWSPLTCPGSLCLASLLPSSSFRASWPRAGLKLASRVTAALCLCPLPCRPACVLVLSVASSS